MIGAFAFVLAAAVSGCGATEDALRRARTEWSAFTNGDFLGAAAEAEEHRTRAISILAEADRLSAGCRPDSSALGRAEFRFEIDLVDARRAHGSNPSLAVLDTDLVKLRDLGLPRTQPAQYEAYVQRDREMQAETRGVLALPPPAAPHGSAPASAGGSCTQTDTPPVPLSPIVPVMLDPSHLRALHGSTIVNVLVGPTGHALSAVVVASSGDGILDQAVANAAQLVTFVPARSGCVATTGTFTMSYTFPHL